MQDDDFEDALARAAHGEVLTDAGANPEVLEALIRVAAARTAAERRPAMRAARLLHEREANDERARPAEDEALEALEDE